jgi:hypothetical protein
MRDRYRQKRRLIEAAIWLDLGAAGVMCGPLAYRQGKPS